MDLKNLRNKRNSSTSAEGVMVVRIQFVVAAVVAALAGCSHEVLDWRNAQVANGKIFNGQDNKPFTGQVTGIPNEQVNAIAPAVSNLFVYAMQHGATYSSAFGEGACSASVVDGDVNGKVECEANGVVYMTFQLDKGHPTGPFQWSEPGATGRSNPPMIEGEFDGNGKLDGELTFRRPDGKGKYMEMKLTHGKYDGDEIWYLKDGQTVGAQIPMKDGHITGPSTVKRMRSTSAGSAPVFEAHYDENGRLDGQFTGWSLANASPARKVFVSEYSHGRQSGRCIGFDESGNPGGSLNAQWDESRRAYINHDAAGMEVVVPSYQCSTNFPLMMADQ